MSGRSPIRQSHSSGTKFEEAIEPTRVAEEFAEELRQRLVDMMNTAALIRANGRRATVIDRVDFEAAFDDIVKPAPRPKRLYLISDVCGVFGTGLIGYAIYVYAGAGPVHQAGHVGILAGAILFVVGVCLKYIDPNK